MALIIKVVNSPGGHLYTTGDGLEQLGGWSTEKAMELTQKPVSTQYESKIMDLGLDGFSQGSKVVEWKAFSKASSGKLTWQEGENNKTTVEAGTQKTVTLDWATRTLTEETKQLEAEPQENGTTGAAEDTDTEAREDTTGSAVDQSDTPIELEANEQCPNPDLPDVPVLVAHEISRNDHEEPSSHTEDKGTDTAKDAPEGQTEDHKAPVSAAEEKSPGNKLRTQTSKVYFEKEMERQRMVQASEEIGLEKDHKDLKRQQSVKDIVVKLSTSNQGSALASPEKPLRDLKMRSPIQGHETTDEEVNANRFKRAPPRDGMQGITGSATQSSDDKDNQDDSVLVGAGGAPIGGAPLSLASFGDSKDSNSPSPLADAMSQISDMVMPVGGGLEVVKQVVIDAAHAFTNTQDDTQKDGADIQTQPTDATARVGEEEPVCTTTTEAGQANGQVVAQVPVPGPGQGDRAADTSSDYQSPEAADGDVEAKEKEDEPTSSNENTAIDAKEASSNENADNASDAAELVLTQLAGLVGAAAVPIRRMSRKLTPAQTFTPPPYLPGGPKGTDTHPAMNPTGNTGTDTLQRSQSRGRSITPQSIFAPPPFFPGQQKPQPLSRNASTISRTSTGPSPSRSSSNKPATPFVPPPFMPSAGAAGLTALGAAPVQPTKDLPASTGVAKQRGTSPGPKTKSAPPPIMPAAAAVVVVGSSVAAAREEDEAKKTDEDKVEQKEDTAQATGQPERAAPPPRPPAPIVAAPSETAPVERTPGPNGAPPPRPAAPPIEHPHTQDIEPKRQDEVQDEAKAIDAELAKAEEKEAEAEASEVVDSGAPPARPSAGPAHAAAHRASHGSREDSEENPNETHAGETHEPGQAMDGADETVALDDQSEKDRAGALETPTPVQDDHKAVQETMDSVSAPHDGWSVPQIEERAADDLTAAAEGMQGTEQVFAEGDGDMDPGMKEVDTGTEHAVDAEEEDEDAKETAAAAAAVAAAAAAAAAIIVAEEQSKDVGVSKEVDVSEQDTKLGTEQRAAEADVLQPVPSITLTNERSEAMGEVTDDVEQANATGATESTPPQDLDGPIPVAAAEGSDTVGDADAAAGKANGVGTGLQSPEATHTKSPRSISPDTTETGAVVGLSDHSEGDEEWHDTNARLGNKRSSTNSCVSNNDSIISGISMYATAEEDNGDSEYEEAPLPEHSTPDTRADVMKSQESMTVEDKPPSRPQSRPTSKVIASATDDGKETEPVDKNVAKGNEMKPSIVQTAVGNNVPSEDVYDWEGGDEKPKKKGMSKAISASKLKGIMGKLTGKKPKKQEA